jgi:hypothetical protein
MSQDEQLRQQFRVAVARAVLDGLFGARKPWATDSERRPYEGRILSTRETRIVRIMK